MSRNANVGALQRQGHFSPGTLVRPDFGGRVAIPPQVERVYAPDRDATAAALRIVLGLPKVLPSAGQGVSR